MAEFTWQLENNGQIELEFQLSKIQKLKFLLNRRKVYYFPVIHNINTGEFGLLDILNNCIKKWILTCTLLVYL